MATGLATTGTGLGTFGFAPMFETLISQFEMQYVFYIMSGILSTGVIFSLSYKPNQKLINDEKNNGGTAAERTSKEAYKVIFRSAPMILLIIIHFIMSAGGDAWFAFTSDRATQIFGIQADHASWLLSIGSDVLTTYLHTYLQ